MVLANCRWFIPSWGECFKALSLSKHLKNLRSHGFELNYWIVSLLLVHSYECILAYKVVFYCFREKNKGSLPTAIKTSW